MADNKRDMIVRVRTKDQSAKGAKSAENNYDKVAASATKMGVAAAAAGVASVAAIAAITTATIKSIDTQVKFAARIGASTKGLLGLQHAANLTGVETTALNMGLQRMTRRVSEAAQGTGEAVKALDELGISAESLNQLKPEEQFAVIAGALENVESQSDKVRLAFKLFDSEGVALVNTLSLGEEGLRAAADEAERLGITINDIEAKNIEEASDSILRMQQASKGAATTLTVSLLPTINDLSDLLTSPAFLDSINNIAGGIGTLAQSFIGLGTAIGESVAALVTMSTATADWENKYGQHTGPTRAATTPAGTFEESLRGGSTQFPSGLSAGGIGDMATPRGHDIRIRGSRGGSKRPRSLFAVPIFRGRIVKPKFDDKGRVRRPLP
jgi:hypothetical protein